MLGQEISARKITWSEVGSAIKSELKKILGKDIECMAQKEDYDYWGIRFSGYKMPIEELKLLLDILDADEEMRDEAIPLPEDNETAIKSIGMLMARVLLSRVIRCIWKTELPDTDVLWLLEINKQLSHNH